MDEAALVVLQLTHHVTHRPDSPAQLEDLLREQVDAVHLGDGLLLQQLVLVLGKALVEVFHDMKIVVDQRVDQRVEQIVRAPRANPAIGLAQALAYRVEHIPGAFLERDQEPFSKDAADLLGLGDAMLVIESDHLEDDQQVGVINFDFWAVRGVEDILEGEGVDVEAVAQGAQHVDIVQTTDIEPLHTLPPGLFQGFFKRDVIPMFEVDFVVDDPVDDRPFGLDLSDMHEAAGWEPYLLGPDFTNHTLAQ